MREYTYNPDDGEFVDFATLDQWKENSEQDQRTIAELNWQLSQMQAQQDRVWNQAIEAFRKALSISPKIYSDGSIDIDDAIDIVLSMQR